MGKPGAYLHLGRKEHELRPAAEAIRDFDDIVVNLPTDEQCEQASRCMNCGVAFCQSGIEFSGMRQVTGCPLHNLIPETNDLIYRRRWDDAAGRLGLTNPFPEFTGRVCPSPCETACNLGLNDSPVTIHDNERALSDYQWERGIDPLPRADGDAPLVSIVGSGPAGLAAAWECARRGLRVCVYERDEKAGGLLMYGIPNMKLPKEIVDRRIRLMEESGIEFHCSVDAAQHAETISAQSDAVIVACGARSARQLSIPGTDLSGVHYALEYLTEATKALLGNRQPTIDANGKDVVVIGGGDTGVDCVATALRQRAKSVKQVIRAQQPAETANAHTAWPGPRSTNAQAYGQAETEAVLGYDPRIFSVDTIGFVGDGGSVAAVTLQDISYEGGRHNVEGSEHDIDAQLVLIAKGFTGPEQTVIDAFANAENVHLAGDARLGSTIVATAMADALEVASRIADTLLT